MDLHGLRSFNYDSFGPISLCVQHKIFGALIHKQIPQIFTYCSILTHIYDQQSLVFITQLKTLLCRAVYDVNDVYLNEKKTLTKLRFNHSVGNAAFSCIFLI